MSDKIVLSNISANPEQASGIAFNQYQCNAQQNLAQHGGQKDTGSVFLISTVGNVTFI